MYEYALPLYPPTDIILACENLANGDGYMASYRVDHKTGKLSFLDAAATNGTRIPDVPASTAHCSFLADGKVAAAANCELTYFPSLS